MINWVDPMTNGEGIESATSTERSKVQMLSVPHSVKEINILLKSFGK